MRFQPDLSPRLTPSPWIAGLLAFFLILMPAAPVARPGAATDQPARLPESLEPLLRSYPPPIENALRGLKQGVEFYLSAKYPQALAALPDPERARATAVADYVQLYRAKSHLMQEDARAALNEFRSLMRIHPSSTQFQSAVLGEIQALLKLRDAPAALKTSQNPGLADNSETIYFRARAHEESGNMREATALYLRVFTDFANSQTAALALDRLHSISPGFMQLRANYNSLLQRAENLILAGRNRDAELLLLKLAPSRAPDIASRESRDLLIAEARVNLGKASLALQNLANVGKRDRERHVRALYFRAQAYRRLKKEDSLLAAKDMAVGAYPQSPFTEKILYSLATYLELAKDHSAASKYYRDIAERFPKGAHTQRARWKTALYAYARGDHAGALAGFWSYLQAYGLGGDSSAAVFWMGKCYERLGDGARAAALYARAKNLANESFYGQRAREAEAALGNPPRKSGRPYEGIDFAKLGLFLDGLKLPQHSLPDPSPRAAEVIEKARQLAFADLPDFALAELRQAQQKFPEEKALSYVMSRVHEMKRDYHSVISTLRRAFPYYDDRPRTALPQEMWALLFPVLHWDAIRALSDKNQVDPTLVLAIIRQESAFSEDARSRAGARGLMQVLPSTGRQIAGPAGVTPYSSGKLYFAETNLKLGILHLSSLLRRYQGRVEFALAAYNAGHTRVAAWQSDFGEVDLEEFVERIPFSETRSYIKQVLTNQAHYRLSTPGSSTSAP